MSVTTDRKWRFTPGWGGASPVVFDTTDFWIEHEFSGSPSKVAFTLHGSWTKTAANIDPLIRRAQIETSILALDQLTGREGLLEVDWDQASPRAMSFTDIMLEDIKPVQADNNRFYEVDIKFSGVVAGNVTRSLSLTQPNPGGTPTPPTINYRGDWDAATRFLVGDSCTYSGALWIALQSNINQPPALNAIWTRQTMVTAPGIAYFIVNEAKAMKSSFKYPYRGIPIRIKNGPGLKTVTFTGIRKKLVSLSTLARRQEAENLIAGYIDKIDQEYFVTTDTKSYGTCLLIDASAGKIDLPDALVFTLVFQTGYNNG